MCFLTSLLTLFIVSANSSGATLAVSREGNLQLYLLHSPNLANSVELFYLLNVIVTIVRVISVINRDENLARPEMKNG